MTCTFYSHKIGFNDLLKIIEKTIPNVIIITKNEEGSSIAEISSKEGLLKASKKIKITYRERETPSFQIPQVSDSPLTDNLKGLYGYIDSLPTKNETIKNLFLQKITTLNSEFSIEETKGILPELKSAIEQLALEFDAILFTQPNTIISKVKTQHFLDKNLELIIDTEGNCEIEKLEVFIESKYYDTPENEITTDQLDRKEKIEAILKEKNVKINKNLPCVESEKETTIRTPKEIAQRVCILGITNMVAFNSISGQEAFDYIKEHQLEEWVTPKEFEFLANPTEESKMYETWKCEGIYTLMWVLNYIDNLAFPNVLCDLNAIPYENYPVGPDKNPNDFINSITTSRSKEEILDMADLYYRLDWACVDARINQRNIEEVNPSIVYERHYTLNWLIQFRNQDWDDVTCDT
ncbi:MULTISPECIES: DUF4272 domain-containing protein [Flavobacterium]|uniref:DUF4272 domain-containing protein n=1 Tax=Flavobacterium jumunjinense TaxID=998845 RepID=A0ABV5GSQ0_9FLAO|nr:MULTISPECIES: DUF4272 domain-containing protein [Flavobacterium]